ncbi:hypothetical protein S40288_11660 [Stachybotrys chartarum IBT 40288]|nr:hypothetical protein S40288_11660 [Stachybotrys chartarum IBT 40288]
MGSDQVPHLGDSNVLAAVSELGLNKPALSIDARFKGGECYVLKLKSDDAASLAVRIPHSTGESSCDDILAIVESEIRILKILEVKGFCWAPRLLGAALTFDNPIKCPFLVLNWVEGETLRWDANFPPQPLRNKVLSQIALLQLFLLECTQKSGMPTYRNEWSLSNRKQESMTAEAFFQRRLQNRHRRVLEGKIPGLSQQDCFDQQALLGQVLGPDRDCKVFAVHHGDIKPANIVIDENHNIRCLIDWGFAQWAPADRQVYVESISSQTSQAAIWQDAEDVDFRTFYLESISSKGMHLHLARTGWKMNDYHY